jgi:hypothetical protein
MMLIWGTQSDGDLRVIAARMYSDAMQHRWMYGQQSGIDSGL